MLSLAQQKDLLGRFIEQQVQHLDRYGALAAQQDAANGASAEPLSERIRRERIMAVVYSALGARGPAAELGNDDEGRLRSAGFSEEDIADIGSKIAFLRDCVPRLHPDGGIGGLVGPENIFFRQTLGEIGAEADNETVDQARRLWFQTISQVMNDADRRYASLTSGQAATAYQTLGGSSTPALSRNRWRNQRFLAPETSSNGVLGEPDQLVEVDSNGSAMLLAGTPHRP